MEPRGQLEQQQVQVLAAVKAESDHGVGRGRCHVLYWSDAGKGRLNVVLMMY